MKIKHITFGIRKRIGTFFYRLSKNLEITESNIHGKVYRINCPNNKYIIENGIYISKVSQLLHRLAVNLNNRIVLQLDKRPIKKNHSSSSFGTRTILNTPDDFLNFLRVNSVTVGDNAEYFMIHGELVLVLKNDEGGKVYLIGTNHISPNSALATQILIQQIKPHIVVTELDLSRAGLKTNSKVFSGQRYKYNYKFVRNTMCEFGFMGGLVFFTLAYMETFVGRLLHVNWGADLRTPFLVTKGALDFMPTTFTEGKPYKILLGDRPIEITFKRMGQSLSAGQKSFVALCVFLSIFLGMKCFLLMVSFRLNKSPRFEKVLLHERDVFLTNSLQEAAKLRFEEPTLVVGIVGKDHVPGIMKLWGTINREDVMEVVQT